jgi:hypothetical protein
MQASKKYLVRYLVAYLQATRSLVIVFSQIKVRTGDRVNIKAIQIFVILREVTYYGTMLNLSLVESHDFLRISDFYL